MTKFAVVGNRTGWTYEEVKKRLQEHEICFLDTIVSGGAEGVDTFSQMYAKEVGALMVIIYPHPHLPSPRRYFDRNRMIAKDCGEMIAFDKKKHSGTLNAINQAKDLGKKVTVYKN